MHTIAYADSIGYTFQTLHNYRNVMYILYITCIDDTAHSVTMKNLLHQPAIHQSRPKCSSSRFDLYNNAYICNTGSAFAGTLI